MWALTLSLLYYVMSWTAWLFLLAGLCVWGSNVILLLRHAKRLASVSSNASLSVVAELSAGTSPDQSIRIVAARKRWIEILSLGIIASTSFVGGYLWRDHQEIQNTFTFHDVKIIKKGDARRWLLSTRYTGEWWVTLCPDYTPTTWEPGYTLKLLVYEDTGCKRLSGPKAGFVIARDRDGNPIKEND